MLSSVHAITWQLASPLCDPLDTVGFFFRLYIPGREEGDFCPLYKSEIKYGKEGISTFEWHPLPTSRILPLDRPDIRLAGNVRLFIYKYGDEDFISRDGSDKGSETMPWNVDKAFHEAVNDSVICSWDIDLTRMSAKYLHGCIDNDRCLLYLELHNATRICINKDCSKNSVAGSILQQLEKLPPMCKSVDVSNIEHHLIAYIDLFTTWRRVRAQKRRLHKLCKQKINQQASKQAETLAIQVRSRALGETKAKNEFLRSLIANFDNGIKDIEKECGVESHALVNALQALAPAAGKVSTSYQLLCGESGARKISSLKSNLEIKQHMVIIEASGAYRLRESEVKGRNNHTIDAQLNIGWTGTADQVDDEQSPSNTLYSFNTFTLNGAPLSPAAWKNAFSPEGYQWDSASDRTNSIALGYAAHLTAKLGIYLGVPLRYPIIFRGSYSIIYDSYEPAGSRQIQDDAQQSADGPTAFPLYCASNRDRPRFAIAVFLLHKNIVQILEHQGITSFGPNELLRNLYALALSARANVPSSWKESLCYKT